MHRALGGAELLLHELAARLPAPVGNLHAARVVQQHRDDVLLRHRGADDQRWTEQAEEHERQRRHPQHGQDDAIAQPSLDANAPVGDGRGHHDRARQRRGDQRPGADVEAELALLEDDRPVAEECLKNGVKHGKLPFSKDGRPQNSTFEPQPFPGPRPET